MHPLADVAQKDLPFDQLLAPRSRGRLNALIARVLRAWMDGWTWYARQGLAPAAVEPVFPPRALPRVRRAAPTRVIRRLALAPPAPLTVADLYDCATPLGCP
ncbi:MAG TPA: hypothetical protein VFS20_14545 [Longimicrobium sp.]|nr:hypothetical protein [Longimicrobium sp.]